VLKKNLHCFCCVKEKKKKKKFCFAFVNLKRIKRFCFLFLVRCVGQFGVIGSLVVVPLLARCCVSLRGFPSFNVTLFLLASVLRSV